MQSDDVPRTRADTDALFEYIHYRPKVSFDEGIREFVKWFEQDWRS